MARWDNRIGPTLFALATLAAVAHAFGLVRRLGGSSLGYGWRRSLSRRICGAKSPDRTPLPQSIHYTVSQEQAAKERVIIIGDVHGCYDELVELLKRCNYSPDNSLVVLVGDVVNKGPKSAEVLRLARKSGFLAVRGNHDDAALAGKLGLRPVEKYAWVEELDDEDVAWLASLPFTLALPHHNALVVHAGLVPGVPLEQQNMSDMYRMRNLVRSGGQGGTLKGGQWVAIEKPSDGIPWATAWPGPEHVYFGHDAKRGLQKELFATGLDTGCLYGRKLTACILPGNQLVSVQAKQAYAPTKAERKKAAAVAAAEAASASSSVDAGALEAEEGEEENRQTVAVD